MPEVQWYYARDDKQHGPVSGAELKQLAASGRLLAADLVWREGLEEWAPAGRLKGLFPDAKAGAATGQGSAIHQGAVPPVAIVDQEHALAATPPGPALSPGSFPDGTLPDAAALDRAVRTTEPAAESPSESRSPGLSIPAVLILLQAVPWATCVLVVLIGVALFTVAFLRAKNASDSASAGVVFGTFFVAAYVLARAGEKASQLMLAWLRRRE